MTKDLWGYGVPGPGERTAADRYAISHQDVYDGFYDEDFDPEDPAEPHDGPWYHYSPHSLPVGTHLTPGYESPWGDNYYEKDGTEHRRNYLWLSPSLTEAVGWAGMTPRRGQDGPGHIYRVEPHSDVLPWNGSGSDGWVADGAHIAEEIPHPWKGPHTAARRTVAQRQLLHRGIPFPEGWVPAPDQFINSVGQHWTSDLSVAEAFSDPVTYGESFGSPDDNEYYRGTGAVVSAWHDPATAKPITDKEILHKLHGGDYPEDKEVTFSSGAPLEVHSIKYLPVGGQEWKEISGVQGNGITAHRTASCSDDEYMHGQCAAWAVAHQREYPHLRFGIDWQRLTPDHPDWDEEDEGDEIWQPQHIFTHDDTHAYDVRGAHPLSDIKQWDDVTLNHSRNDVLSTGMHEMGWEPESDVVRRVSPHTAARTAMPTWCDRTASGDDYRLQHRPGGPDHGAPFHDLHEMWSEDIYDHPEWYDSMDYGIKDIQRQLNQARGNPDHPVVIYRALPSGKTNINTGDWVTTSLQYARQHSIQNENPDDDLPIVRSTVPAKHLWTNNDLHEWGYHGPSHQGELLRNRES